jgi:hypothetical protein
MSTQDTAISKLAILERENTRLRGNEQASIDLFKQLSKQVGTYYGELIAEHLSVLGDKKYNAKDWDLADRNGEQ